MNQEDDLYNIDATSEPDKSLVVQQNALTEKQVETASKQIELRSKLLTIALKAVKPHDLQDFDGKPYLEGEGAARIMAVIRGFKVGEAKFNIENIHPHYFVECNIPMEFMDATTVAIGDCSTADPFFTGRDGQSGQYKKHLDRTGSDTMAARLILGDAKKKARENAISRGVTELLGLKGLSWSDLEALGFRRTEAGASVAFKKGSQGAELKVLTVSELNLLAKGSVANLRGFFVSARNRKGTNKAGKAYEVTSYQITDNHSTINISKYGPDKLFTPGAEVFAEKVVVDEYQGTKQFLAESIEITEPLEPGSNN